MIAGNRRLRQCELWPAPCPGVQRSTLCSMYDVLLVAVGSACGGVLRHLLVLSAQRWAGDGFPWGTWLVNVLGCLAIGMVGARASAAWQRELLMVGVLGGFTTFSAFTWQACGLWRDGRVLAAGGYVLASVVVCLGATALGWRLAQR